MNDRELLEAAARAAGIEIEWIEHEFEACRLLRRVMPEPVHPLASKWTWWNPLMDDADAFRLAVDLGIDVNFFEGSVEADHESFILARSMPYGNDKHAATRRAITRAAAALSDQR